jgi:hypothetical protein
MEYSEFLQKLKEIEHMGYVPSHRSGDTGIGKTLEDLLGIQENNISGPDFSTYELKAARKNSSSMLTLFTKAPLPKGANNRLLEAFGYPERKTRGRGKQISLIGRTTPNSVPTREKELHVTVDSLKPNSVGLQLEVRQDRVYVKNNRNVDAYYDQPVLKEAFDKKYHRLAYVLADNRKEAGKEFFHYDEAYLLDGFDFVKFLRLIGSGELKLDLRMGHYPDGSPHDHGTGFRIMPRHLPSCFETIQQIL